MSNKVLHSELLSQTFQTLSKDKTFKHSLTKAEISQAIDTFLQAIEELLLEGKTITLKNIGLLQTFKSTRTEVVNPKTRQKITIPVRTKVRLKASKKININLNK